MPHEVQDDFKSRYRCPKCGAKARIASGNCPECGFIGPMEHKDIRLRAANAAAKAVAVPPLTGRQDAGNQKSPEVFRMTSRYTCPRCGTRIDKAYGRCPNERSCGYSGPMQSRDNHQ